MKSRTRLITSLEIVILLSAAGALAWVAFMDPGNPTIENVTLVWKDGKNLIMEDGHFSPSFDSSAFDETVNLAVDVKVRRTDPRRSFEYAAIVPERALIDQASFYETGFAYPVKVDPGESISVYCGMRGLPKQSIERIRARFKSHGIGHLIVGRFTPGADVLTVEDGYWNPLLNFLGLRRIWIRMQ